MNKVRAFFYLQFTGALFGFDPVNVSGTVKDPAGTPLSGSNVMILGTVHGSATNAEGDYSFMVPAKTISDNRAQIRASYIGYRSITDTLYFNGKAEIRKDLVLKRDILGMETVVVTGPGGLEEKKKLGVLVESVKMETAQRSGEVNIITALRGSIPGFEIKKTSGDAGTNAYFRIRGVGTISRNTEPLLVVDGIPLLESADISAWLEAYAIRGAVL